MTGSANADSDDFCTVVDEFAMPHPLVTRLAPAFFYCYMKSAVREISNELSMLKSVMK